MSDFAPIAIVGRGCVVPGANDPRTLWARVLSGDDLTGPSSAERWGLDPGRVCNDPREPSASARGGYVTGFDALWRHDTFALPPEALVGIPEGWRWLMHACAQALTEAGVGLDGGARAGLVLGSLGYATREFADAAAARWCGAEGGPHPALEGQTGALRWASDACGVHGPRVALDAACASGLYALKTACDLLHARRADVVLAAGLNAADDLFLHIGFTALGALSRRGRSTPLSTEADGLLPAEGAAVVALKRLDDAVANGDRILAIVRGVGLSNDGRGPGLLAPTTAGQQRAIRAAWAASGLDPATLDYLECHATATPVGDREEILSVRAVFGDAHRLRLGSLKAQLGHLITASGGAALIKLCGAFEAGSLPPAPSIACELPLPEIAESELVLERTAIGWQPGEHARRAAVDAFGFGGCNAHAILEGPEGVEALVAKRRGRPKPAVAPVVAPAVGDDLAIVACELSVGEAGDSAAILRVLMGREAPSRRVRDLQLAVRGLGFPPADLRHALPQQLLVLRAAQRLKPAIEGLDRSRVGVFIGADVDPAGARHGCRWRLDHWLQHAATAAERDAVVPALEAAGVLGTMPNMPANRINSALDLGGAGLVLSEGENSGGWALSLAADAIARGELDAALVGAVDASGGAFGDDPERADAVVLLLVVAGSKVGDRAVLARIARTSEVDTVPDVLAPWMDTGIARELVDIGVAALCCHHALLPGTPALPWTGANRSCQLHGWDVFATGNAAGVSDEPAATLALAPDRASFGQKHRGEVAFVFTGAAAAYPGAGRTLWQGIPELAAELRARAPNLTSALPRLVSGAPLSFLDQLQLATLLSQSHARLLALLGVRPDATLGLSSGETNALLASGAWTDPDGLFAAVSESGMYDLHLAGEHRTLRASWGVTADSTVNWRCYRVLHPVDALKTAIAATTGRVPREVVRLLIVHHANDVVIGGSDEACRALIAKLGARSTPLGHDLLVHCPELEPFAADWYAVHHRPTQSITTPRLYANAINAPFVPTSERCAELLLAQARDTAVFSATVERAYADGVRVFIEMGPRSACTAWIGEILGARPHCAVSLDGSRGSLRDIAAALAQLIESGVAVDRDRWNSWMSQLRSIADIAASADGMLALAGHRSLPEFHAPNCTTLAVPAAPKLAPVLPDLLHVVQAPALIIAPEPVKRQKLVHAQPTSLALAALADTQAALLRVHDILVSQAKDRSLRVTRKVQVARPTHAVPDVTPPVVAEAPTPRVYPGPQFDRAQLEHLSHRRISEVFGPAFAGQDDYPRQVRMPMPPLLLADRVLGIDAIAASMKTGTIWTETDVREDSWYLQDGRMPAGILIESGQADLLLISWLGIDLTNRGERIYRLLGCELTFAGGLPSVGETLHYSIAIDSHARHGDVGLFFFHYDCTVDGALRLRVKEGQAGFFTDAELADSAGILWNPLEDLPDASAPIAGAKPGIDVRSAYDEAAVSAFAAGNILEAFGDSFKRGAGHTRTPRIAGGRMQLFDRVDELDADGGPWKRGYLRASLPITPDSWFFAGHFHNDPCMPGTLMFEGCLQTMAFYMAALGYTVDRDGAVFEPVPDRPYQLRCRGQVTPKSKMVTYEVFVAELHDGPVPTLVADLLCTVDGLKAFHCGRMALRLTPDFPLGARELAAMDADVGEVAEQNGFRYGQASLLACGSGDPVAAFGELYSSLPPGRRVPRLPGPPYHFISRVRSLSHAPGGMQAGVVAETAYDIPPDAWYIDAHPTGQMPACVLIEAALQPCGWLASYVGCAVVEADEVYFRNLDGKGVLHRPVRADDGTLVVKAKLKSLSRAGGMTLVSFDVACTVGDEAIYDLTTTFGFFPKAALEGQAGLTATDEQRAWMSLPGTVDLLATLDAAARELLPAPMLRMCERVTHRNVADDGSAQLRGEKTVRADEWFFKAHFFQDPVQPGSLGIEALVQLLQAHLLLSGAKAAIPDGAFADLSATTPGTWQFRGQVLPHAKQVTLTLDAEPIQRTPSGWRARAAGSVWVDGLRIYGVQGLSVSWEGTPTDGNSLRFDAATEPWWNDHRPTYTVPVVPAMALASRALSLVADAQKVIGVEGMTFRRWLSLESARTLSVERAGQSFTLVDTERGDIVCDGTLMVGTAYRSAPAPVAPLGADAVPLDNLYDNGALFHGPAYQRLRGGRRSAQGADVTIAFETALDTRERVSHFVLDAALHAVPHDAMQEWFPDVAPGQIAYPAMIERVELFADAPSGGECEVRVRPAGLREGSARYPRIHAQLLLNGSVWAELTLVEVCLPATRLGSLSGTARRAFLRDGEFVAGARLSDEASGVSTLNPRIVTQADWLAGTVDTVYGLPASSPDRIATIAATEHAAQRIAVHPRAIAIGQNGSVSTPALPLLDYQVAIERSGRSVTVRDVAPPAVDVARILKWWNDTDWQSASPDIRALFMAATAQFVSGVRLLDPASRETIATQPILLLANHQVAIESALAGIALAPMLGRPLLTVAKAEHRSTWVGRLALQLNDARRGDAIIFVDRTRQEEMLGHLQTMGRVAHSGARALLVHAEGTRSLAGSQPVTTVSAVWSDLAVQAGLTIVPLRFARGLPSAGVDVRKDFPVGYGAQELILGRPISGASLAALRLDQRRTRVLDGFAELDAFDGEPRGDAALSAQVEAACAKWSLDEMRAVFLVMQARAAGWALDANGLPTDAYAAADERHPFWAWFHGPAANAVRVAQRDSAQ